MRILAGENPTDVLNLGNPLDVAALLPLPSMREFILQKPCEYSECGWEGCVLTQKTHMK